MKLAITGGKGGTGKSTVATALASELANSGDVLLMDLDVDCPDDHLILGIELEKVKDIKNMIPTFDPDKCTRCGKCSKVCKENAIVQVKDKLPILVAEQCTGCKACKIACSTGAISEEKQIIGEIRKGSRKNLKFISGETKVGIEESSLIVNAVKKYASYGKTTILDTAAGTHCPVIAALVDCDEAWAVTEPTPLGNHDLQLILELTEKLKIPTKIIINRSDIASNEQIEKTAHSYNVPIIAKIPYSKQIIEQYCKGQPVEHPEIKKLTELIK